MKKVVTILLIAVMAFALASTAFASGYSYSNGFIVGSYDSDQWIETYCEGAKLGGKDVNFNCNTGDTPQLEQGESDKTVTVEVYENFVPVATYTVVIPGTAPVVEPTEEPVQPTEEPVQPTEEPVQPTEEPVQPTEEPVQPTEEPVQPTAEPVKPTAEPVKPTAKPADPTTKPVETKAPSGNAGGHSGSKTAANGKDAVPKTGEADYTVVLLAVVLAGATGMVVLGKKRGKQN